MLCYDKSISTRLTPREVIDKLTTLLAPGEFEGWIEENRFQFRRMISYRNPFVPVVQGLIEPCDNGSVIRLTMRLTWPTLIFYGAWMLASVFFGCAYLVTVLATERFSWLAIAVSIAFPVFGYLVGAPAFWLEVMRSKQMLSQALTADKSSANGDPFIERMATT